jgi:hypothetical protein
LSTILFNQSACATTSSSTIPQSIPGRSSTQSTVELITKALASDTFDGRESLTSGGKAAREWLKRWFSDHKFPPAGSEPNSYEQSFDKGVNLIAVIPPKRSIAAIKPRVILSAHYDHWGTSCNHRVEAHSAICNGAADNAAGVAVVLAAAETLAQTIDAPVAITLWDAEEKGLLGSKHFVGQPTFDLSEVQLMINMDIVGLNLFKGMESDHFLIGVETGGADLIRDVQKITVQSELRMHLLSYALGDRRSDMTSFVRGGLKIPTLFFSDGDGSVYHSDADEASVINYSKVAAVSVMVAGLTAEALKPATRYTFKAPQIVGPAALPLFSDTAVLSDLVGSILKVADVNKLTPEQKSQLADSQSKLTAIIQAGPANFGMPAMQQTGATALQITKISRGLGFIP